MERTEKAERQMTLRLFFCQLYYRHRALTAVLSLLSVFHSEPAMNLIDRVKRLLLSPQTEWEAIDAEATTPAELYTGYVMPLAAVGPVARIIGFSIFGFTVPGLGTYRVPIGAAVTSAISSYVLQLIAVYLLALIIDALAPTFSGQRSRIQALKVAVYSCTAAWVAGIFALIPVLSLLMVLGLYSVYLLYVGLPILMKPPRERAMGYTLVVVLTAIVLFMIIGTISAHFMPVPTSAITVP
jgi:Yip1-like protein